MRSRKRGACGPVLIHWKQFLDTTFNFLCMCWCIALLEICIVVFLNKKCLYQYCVSTWLYINTTYSWLFITILVQWFIEMNCALRTAQPCCKHCILILTHDMLISAWLSNCSDSVAVPVPSIKRWWTMSSYIKLIIFWNWYISWPLFVKFWNVWNEVHF